MLCRCTLGLALAVLAAPYARCAEVPAELHLTHARSVQGPGRFDASGIMARDGQLYVVTDRHGDTIFKLVCEGDVARAEPFVTFSGPEPYPWIGYMDLEGIAPAPDGGFFLAPEWGFAVCHVPADGGTARWVTPDLKAAAATVGLFATKDAFVEGLAPLESGGFLIACERAPRGLVEIGTQDGHPWVSAQNMEFSRYPVPAARGLDWSDLAVWRGRVFALARNQHLVVELERSALGRWREGRAWSYAAAENGAPHRFTDMRYGQAEGLAVTDQAIFVLIDNNNLARETDAGDRRSWLFEFSNTIAP